MKVTVEGTAREFLDLADVLEAIRNPVYAVRVRENQNASARDVGDVQTRDDVPNRFREEGV